jgi:hypothetical protein
MPPAPHAAPRRRRAAQAAALALACGAGVGCAAGDTPVLWSGRLVDDPLWVGGIESLEGGSLWARDPSGAQLAEAAPVEGWAGGLALQLDPGSALELVVEASGYTTTVWPTMAPEGDAFWLDGALYPRAAEVLAALAADHLPGAPLPSAGATAGLWIEPDPTSAWGEGLVEVDVAGAARVDLRLSPTGRWIVAADGVPDVILILNLPPGPVEVRPLPASGATAAISLHLEAGELGMLPRLTP